MKTTTQNANLTTTETVCMLIGLVLMLCVVGLVVVEITKPVVNVSTSQHGTVVHTVRIR